MAYLVVRIKGTVNIPQQAKKTLDGLNLDKRFRATIVPEGAEYLGMLRRVKDEVAWTKADVSIIKELLEKRGRKTGYKPITKPDLPNGYNSIDDLATAIAENKISMSSLERSNHGLLLALQRADLREKPRPNICKTEFLETTASWPR